MREIENQIARLEMRSEQLGVHLQELARNSHQAAEARSQLYAVLQELAQLKAERDRRKALLDFAA
jgi:hypothetical protein